MRRPRMADVGGVCRVPEHLRASTWRTSPEQCRLLGRDLEYELDRDRVLLERIAEDRSRWVLGRLVSGGRRWAGR